MSEYDAGWKEKVENDPMLLNEGAIDPVLGKKVRVLLLATKSCIVYLCQDLYVEHWYTDNFVEPEEKVYSEVIGRMTHLEAQSMNLLAPEHMEPFRFMIGEAVARMLDEKTSEHAMEIMDKAEDFMNKRSKERARIWYLFASFLTAIPFLLIGLGLWLLQTPIIARYGASAFQVAFGAFLGAPGALLSVITRSTNINVEAAAGPRIHYLEGGARVIVGVIGAFIAALAVKANFALGVINDTKAGLPLLMLLCVIAGYSERLVPELIHRVEDSTAKDDTSGGK